MDILKQFQNPDNTLRGKPFWSWNGELKMQELIRQVDVSHDMGFGGFFMHSRCGLITEYLGDEWFELINGATDRAEELGMEAWLYDEDRWPSGSAGGIVSKNEKYRTRYIDLTIVPVDGFKWDDDILAAFAANIDDINMDSYKRIYDPSEAQGFRCVLVFRVVLMQCHSNYNGYTYIDTMSREAVDEFIRVTHEAYKAKCGGRVGTTIKGIFTDEPHRGSLLDGFGISDGGAYIPYTFKLFDEFKSRYGFDLLERLPEVYFRLNGESLNEVKWRYTELIQDLFVENFVTPIQEWCDANNMLFTGHFLHEDSLTAQVDMFGNLMRGYEVMSYPGVDVLTEHNCNYNIVKQLTSVARQTGKKWLLSELYGCTGWQFNLEAHKNQGDWQALLGINLRCPHLSWYTMEGEGKRDYPASIFHQSAWYKEYKYVEDYFARFNLVMMTGKPECDVLYLSPIESVMAQVNLGWAKNLGPQHDCIIDVEKDYNAITGWLYGGHTDFDIGDEAMINRLHKINETGRETLLTVGEASYRVVVVGGMRTMRSDTLKWLKNFAKKGGKVLFVGDVPSYVDAKLSDDVKEFAKKATCIPMDQESFTKTVSEMSTCFVRVDNPSIFTQLRRDGDKLYMVMLNMDRREAKKNVNVTITENGYLQEWDLASGTRYDAGDAARILTIDFEAGQERVFCVAKSYEALPKKPSYTTVKTIEVGDFAGYTLDEPNMLLLDMAEVSVNGGQWQPKTEILKADWFVRDSFNLPHRGGEMLQPWFVRKNGVSVVGKANVRFTFFADVIPEGTLYLCMERPENFIVKVNGTAIDTSKQDGFWVDIAFKKVALDNSLLKLGENIVELETDYTEATNLEALYIIGEFGVKVDGCVNTMIEMPKTISLGNLFEQGLPFYGGKIVYHTDVKADLAEVAFDQIHGGCLVVNPETDKAFVGWKPYTAVVNGKDGIDIELALTRRNTFGPLHQYPLDVGAYGPGNFTTGGDGYKDEYNFYPCGLLTAPIIRVLKEN